MKHVLITRFNLKNKQWKQSKKGQDTSTDDWLDNRISLFKTYCLPSVINQNNKNFVWLLLLDTSTSKHHREIVEHLIAPYKHFKVLYCDGFENLIPTLQAAIKLELTDCDEFLISSRLDNDDSIHCDFIDAVQNQFIPVHDTVIDARTGYQLILKPQNKAVKNYRLAYNPFTSLIERTDNYNTVLHKEHYDFKTLTSQQIITNKRLWLQVIHEHNIINVHDYSKPYSTNFNSKSFGLDETLGITTKNNRLKNIVFTPIRVLFWLKLKVKLGFTKR